MAANHIWQGVTCVCSSPNHLLFGFTDASFATPQLDRLLGNARSVVAGRSTHQPGRVCWSAQPPKGFLACPKRFLLLADPAVVGDSRIDSVHGHPFSWHRRAQRKGQRLDRAFCGNVGRSLGIGPPA